MSLALHVPLKRITLNHCELLSEVSVLLTVYAGLCFQLDFLSAGVEIALFALVCSSSILLKPYWDLIFRERSESDQRWQDITLSRKPRS